MPPRKGGVLRRLAVSSSAAWTCARILASLFAFAASLGLQEPLPFPEDAQRLDLCCAEYSDQQYMEGHPAYIGERLVAALQDSYAQLNSHGSVKLAEFYRFRQD